MGRKWIVCAVCAAAFAGALILSGCGLPGAPLPPSLNLPERVTDLSAVRTGNEVTLTWTMPKKNTDKLLLEDNVTARICRRESSAGECVTAGTAEFAPGTDAAFTETLPGTLAAGEPRALSYFVELENHKGRSAGLSNAADVAAGSAPAAVMDLSAEIAKNGVMLRWSPGAAEEAGMTVRLERTLLTPQPKAEQKKAQESLLAASAEPVKRTLLVAADAQSGQALDRALDKDIRFGGTYSYRAQRVISVTADGQKLELDGPFSAPVRIDAVNIFPPDVPAGLAAVATAGVSGAGANAGTNSGPAIDLSWTPDTEADLVGYIVYRCEPAAAGDGAWQRISSERPVVGPGFHDGNVVIGHTYDYAVSAIDEEGHESARSAEAEETVPGP